jgi:hypothetical protein
MVGVQLADGSPFQDYTEHDARQQPQDFRYPAPPGPLQAKEEQEVDEYFEQDEINRDVIHAVCEISKIPVERNSQIVGVEEFIPLIPYIPLLDRILTKKGYFVINSNGLTFVPSSLS